MDAFKLLWPHLQNLANLHITKYVNTGDRIYDTCLIGICMVLLSTIVNNIQKILDYIINFYKILKYKDTDIFNPNDLDPKDYDMNALEKYNFSFILSHENLYFEDKRSCDRIQSRIIEWIEKTYGLLLCEESVELIYNQKKLKPSNTTKNINIKMPILRFIQNNKFEYIIYVNNRLYCNDRNKLSDFINQFDPDDEILSDSNRYVYEIGSKGGLQRKQQVNKHKTFDTLFFEQKEELLALLEKFETGTLYPKGLSLSNKIGLGFYGPPGTAKTAVGIAIANKTNRHILLMSSLLVAPQDKILDIVETCRKTHVIILDEADFILSKESNEKTNYLELISNATNSDEYDKIKELASFEKTKMSTEEFMLKLLDSFGDDNDRIIIMNTNNPEKINKKYLRPGRIDFIGYFGYCTLKMFRDITHSVYSNIDELIQQNKDKVNDALRLNLTPVIVINILVSPLSKTFNAFLDNLLLEKKQHYIGKLER